MATKKSATKRTAAKKPVVESAKKKPDATAVSGTGSLFGDADAVEPNGADASARDGDSALVESPPADAESGVTDLRAAPQERKTLLLPDETNSGQETPFPVDAAAQSWSVVTNHQNMAYMLAAGMVMGPAGFGGKHYEDASSLAPGWIPLFMNRIPKTMVSKAKRERKDLRACIAHFDLSVLRGHVQVLSKNGEWRQTSLPGPVQSDDVAVLVRSPLPLSALTGASFESEGDRKALEDVARSVSNVDVEGLPILIDAAPFDGASDDEWTDPGVDVSAGQDFVPAKAQAIGGVLALLYHLANRTDLGGASFRLACGDASPADVAMISREPVLSGFSGWLEPDAISSVEADVSSRLYWGVVDALVDARFTGASDSAVDLVISYLDDVALSPTEDHTYRPRLKRLMDELRRIAGFGGATVSELLERNKGALSRPLLLLCLRERAEELFDFLDFSLSDNELILSAILFGVRDGWIGMPRQLRGSTDLQRFISQRMVEIANAKDELRVDSKVSRPVPLRELFSTSDSQFSREQGEIATEIARTCGWSECLTTRISLARGQYRLEVGEDGVDVVVTGGQIGVRSYVDEASFLKRLGAWPPLDLGRETEVRARLERRGHIGCA